MIERIIEFSARNRFLVLLAYALIVAWGIWSMQTTPVDAIPDVFVGIGFTDDAAVIAAVLATLGAHLKPRHHDQAAQALRRLREEEEA